MIKVIPLKDVHPNSGFNLNRTKSSCMAYNGKDFTKAAAILIEYRFPLVNVIIPSLHQAIELLTKALILWIDENINPRNINHGTLKAMENYKAKIPIFSQIVSNDANLITELKEGYYCARYGESFVSFDKKDMDQCMAIAVNLIDAYYDLTKIPLIEKHFPTKPRETTTAHQTASD